MARKHLPNKLSSMNTMKYMPKFSDKFNICMSARNDQYNVCVWERHTEKEAEKEKERDTETERYSERVKESIYSASYNTVMLSRNTMGS